ncbi:UNVERIFIED_CONTAM: protein NRT1/ PTR FAMILY 6.1 [Sesamum radiatum]|uniref:Protein NRT1/ PTR FAMILY 6.1 n=1 Tax=Sesamum radiatum TaxID=300843 RepID=A0AAW2MZD2_SESRA
MDAREIRSPELLPEASPVSLEANVESHRRKRLGIYFLESDDRRTALGGGYTSGATPVNIHGKPIPEFTISKTGGWIAAFFIFGISQASSVLGGFLADAYLGRYWTIAIFTTIYLGIALLLGNCEPAKPWQMLYLYTVLYITGFGAAGIRPCVSSFGADQFDERSRDYKEHLDRFFNFFYLSVTVGAIIAFTQHEFVGLYELPGQRSAIKGSSKIPHTEDFRCLDKAALRLKEDGVNPSPWRLCTVTQVEEIKILLKLVPIPACTIMLNLILTEYLTLSVQQAYTLNTHMGHLKLPVTCMPVFPGLSIFLLLSLYYSVFVPLSRRITGHPHGASQLQRVGIGLAVSILSVAWAGMFERYRRNYAIEHGYEASFLTPMPDLSAYWLLIQYCLIGIAEVFCIVGLLEFLYEEAPDAMRSIGSAYAAVAGGLGCFAATILNNIVKSVTGDVEKRKPSWLSQNVNTGRFDYFYWLLTVMSVINFCAFLLAARRYQYRANQVNDIREQASIQPSTKDHVVP